MNRHNRQSIRLKGYDYAQAGAYFVTICTQGRVHLFGDVVNGEMVLNDAGGAAQICWHDIPAHYPNIRLHEFIVMPNHIHGIIEIAGGVGAENIPPVQMKNMPPIQRQNIPSPPLGNIVRGFKIGVTKWCQKNHLHPIGKSVWQRNYWEHIVRDASEYQRIATYIRNNPLKWDMDQLNQTGDEMCEPHQEYADEVWMV